MAYCRLGATAAQVLAERAIPVQSIAARSSMWRADCGILTTIHPSALLRLKDEEDKRPGYANFVSDLRSIEQLAEVSSGEAKSGPRAAG